MLIQVGKAPAERSPQIAGKEIHARRPAHTIQAQQLRLGRSNRHHNAEGAEECVRLIGQIRLVHGYLDERIQSLRSSQRRGSTVLPNRLAVRKELNARIVGVQLEMVQKRDGLDAGQNDILGDFCTQSAQTA